MPHITEVADSELVREMGDDFFSAFNEGRNDEASFQGVEITIWSAVLDENTCDFCAWADSRKFAVNESGIVPPAHFGCKCILVYTSEEDVLSEELDEFELWENPPSYVFPIGRKSK